MPDPTNKPRNPGLRTFNQDAFMYEVADEIRSGINEDKNKGQTTGAGPQQPSSKQYETQSKNPK